MPDPRLRFPDRLRALFAPKFKKVNPPPPARPEDLTTAHERAADVALREESAKVASAKPGARNHQLFRSAAALGNIVGFGCLAEKHVVAALTAAASSSGLADDDGWHQVRATITSGLVKGKQTPRDPAPSATERLKRER